MFDAHVHLQDPRIAAVLSDVIRRAAETGITGACCCGTSPDDWEAVSILAEASLPFVLVPAFGVHPWYVRDLPADWFEMLIARLEHHPVAVLGEIGLDGLRDDVPADLQEQIFVQQLELAEHMRLPVVLHGARVWGRLVELIKPYAHRVPSFVVHGFGSSFEILKRIVNMGGYVSFAGSICNPKSAKIRAAAKEIPDCQLLIETDTPDIFPQGGGASLIGTDGKPLNQLSNLKRVLEEIAALRGITPEVLSDITGANARRALLSIHG